MYRLPGSLVLQLEVKKHNFPPLLGNKSGVATGKEKENYTETTSL